MGDFNLPNINWPTLTGSTATDVRTISILRNEARAGSPGLKHIHTTIYVLTCLCKQGLHLPLPISKNLVYLMIFFFPYLLVSPQVLLTWTPSLFYLRHEGDVYDALPNNPM